MHEIAAAGGGIRSSLEAVRKAGKRLLTEKVSGCAARHGRHGTTTVEAKSGYGLTVESELKSLEAIRDAASQWPGTVVATLLGAHMVPKEFQGCSQKYVETVCIEMIPLGGEAEARPVRGRVLRSGRVYGGGNRADICSRGRARIQRTGAYGPAFRDTIAAISAIQSGFIRSHGSCERRRYCRNWPSTTPSPRWCPGANYFLGLKEYPNARSLIDAGVPVALATDYNPGTSPTISMPMAMSLACTQMKMSPAEAIAAATINGAWALRMAERKGSIERAKMRISRYLRSKTTARFHTGSAPIVVP